MRKIAVLCVALCSLIVASQLNTAEANVVWASSAAVQSKDTGITENRPISRATGTPDKLRWYVESDAAWEETDAGDGNTSSGSIGGRLTFPGLCFAGDDSVFGVFGPSDGTSEWLITAQVIGYTTSGGYTSTSGSLVNIPKVSSNGLRIFFPFDNPGSSTLVTSVDIEFTFYGTAAFKLDTIGAPEPGTFILFGVGLLGMGLYARQRRRRKKTA